MRTDKFYPQHSKWSLGKVAKKFKTIKLDGAFQRWGGVEKHSGWAFEDSRAYIESAISGSVYNTIIFANVNENISYAKSVNDEESLAYYEAIAAEGYELLSIDGNNSTSTIYHFISNHEEMYVMKDDQKKLYSELEESEREAIHDDEKLRVVILDRIGIRDVCNLFRKLNTSTKLNDQEFRQARWSKLSKFIRELANQHKDIFTNFVFKGVEPLDKRLHEEITAQLCLRIEKDDPSSLKKRFLDEFYEESSALKPGTETNVKKILTIASKMSEHFSGVSKSKKITKGKLHSLFLLIEMAIDEDYEILDNKGFLEWFLKVDNEFDQLSLQIIEADKQEKSYTYWTKTYGQSKYYKKIKAILIERLMLDLEDLETAKILKPKRTGAQAFTFKDAKRLYFLQGGKTRTGMEIEILDLYASGKYEVDHVEPVADGGETTIPNGELMTMHDNRSKGASSNEPHFQHQQQ